MDKLESITSTKNLSCSGILSNYLRDEVGDYSDNLKVITKQVDPTHTSGVIKKHDIIAMTQNRGGTRGNPNITIKKIKRCERGDVIATRERRLILFAQLT